MSYDPESPFVGGSDDVVEVDQEAVEDAEQSALYDKFRGVVEGFFNEHPTTDWVLVGSESSAVMDSGCESSLFSEEFIAELSRDFDEPLYVFRRPVHIEPTHPSPNLPSER